MDMYIVLDTLYLQQTAGEAEPWQFLCKVDAAVQVQGWCHAMCLNRSRQRRRHRRGMEDWANLLEHAFNADASPAFQHWLRHCSGWQWRPPDNPAVRPEDALVGFTCRFLLNLHSMELGNPSHAATETLTSEHRFRP